ncbi:MAG TPA: hypothetical protein VIJ93_03465, partial [bacterium]
MRGKSNFKFIDRWIGIPLVWFLGLFAKKGTSSASALSEGDHVLVVKLSALGDTLLLLPVFKAVKAKVGAKGRVVAIATPINQGVLEKNLSIDQLFILDFGKFIRNPGEFFKFLGQLKAEKVRVALDFDQWLRVSPLLCYLSGAAIRF